MADTVAKTVELNLLVKGDVTSRAALDALDARAKQLKKDFPEFTAKIDMAQAMARLSVFRKEFKETADAIRKPIAPPPVLTAQATRALAAIGAEAEKLKKNFPKFTAHIDDTAYKAQLALMASEAQITADRINKALSGAASKAAAGGIGSRIGTQISGLLGRGGGIGGGGIGTAGAGAGGSAASGAASGGAGLLSALPGPLSNPYVAGGAAAAALVALPVLAQAAATAITFTLGAALAGIGVSGAQGTAKVQAAFTGLKTHASADLKTIGTSFVPVMTSVYNTATSVLDKMTPVFAGAEKTISGPFKLFADTLIKAFGSPAVQQSIQAVAKAFGALLTALAPSLPGDINNIAAGITKIANAVAKNPGAFRDFISFLFAVTGGALTAIAGLTRFASYIETHFVPLFDGVRHAVAKAWDAVLANTILTWNQVYGATIGVAIRLGHNVEVQFNNLKQWIWNDFLVPVTGWFDRTMPDSLIRSVNSIRNDFINPFTTAFNNLRNWVYNDFVRPVAGFFDSTLPNAFGAGEQAIGRLWGRVEGVIRGPIHTVAHSVLIPLFNAIDVVTSFVNLNHPLAGAVSFLGGLAEGGMVRGGSPGRDSVLAALMPGEVVVPAAMVAGGAVDHLRGLLPGFAAGGFVNPIGLNLTPERIDMGVDYGGNGPLFALGSGTITSLYNSGWPGGGFIGLHLDQTPPGGVPWWYYAEDVSPYKIGVGSQVSAGQYIAQATGGSSGIEVGYAAPPAIGSTMASVTGQVRNGNVNNTGWGLAASALIASLGGRAGIGSGQISTPGISGGFAGIIKTVEQIFAGLGNVAKVAIDLAHGDVGGAERALLGLIPGSAGGAGGAFAKMLLQLPVTLAGDVMQFIVKGVKSFANANAGGGGGGGIGPVSGPADAGPGQAQNYARSRLGAFGWDVGQFLPLQSLWNRESNWNRFADNPSSGAYGIAQALPASKYPFAGQAAGGSHASAQIDWGLGYIKGRYGTPAGAWGHEVGFNWYGGGTPSAAPGWGVVGERGPELVRFTGGEQVIPGYATGGAVTAREGAAYLRAWQTKRGGGFGAAWGPITVNAQIDAMNAAIRRNTTLAGAGGLSAAQHRHYAAMATDERWRLAALLRERDIERAWRGQLSASDVALSSWIRAAGAAPSLARNVRAWKAQRAWQTGTINVISKMLGLSAAQIAADERAGLLGPGGAALPRITHTYGGDVANTIGAYIAKVAGPLGAARGLRVGVFDRGGWLLPGQLAYNGSSRAEQVIPSGGAGAGGGVVRLEVHGGSSEFERFMAGFIRKYVKIHGGSPQKAFAPH